MFSNVLSANKFEDLDYLAHINTPNVVRDMDIIRSLLRYQTINYLGYSYGTVLGTMYAATFPDHVGNMVLDGKYYIINRHAKE